jgi:hypothetical protein
MAEYRGPDFSNREKDVMVVTLDTDIKILPPTVDINKGMVKVAQMVEQAAEGTLDYATVDMDEYLAIVAATMSNNTDMRRITPEYLNSIGFDMSDIGEFLGGYLFFVTRLLEGKN